MESPNVAKLSDKAIFCTSDGTKVTKVFHYIWTKVLSFSKGQAKTLIIFKTTIAKIFIKMSKSF